MIFQCLHGTNPIRFAPSVVQTDGSFYRVKHLGRVAALLYHDTNTFKNVKTMVNACNSYETEWASVLHGLVFSLEHNASQIYIENDNLGVVQSLSNYVKKGKKGKRETEYVQHYKYEIMHLAKQTETTAIRWIPRSKNRADALFREML